METETEVPVLRFPSGDAINPPLAELLKAKKAAERAYLDFPPPDPGADEESQVRHAIQKRRLDKAWCDAIRAFNRAAEDVAAGRPSDAEIISRTRLALSAIQEAAEGLAALHPGNNATALLIASLAKETLANGGRSQ